MKGSLLFHLFLLFVLFQFSQNLYEASKSVSHEENQRHKFSKHKISKLKSLPETKFQLQSKLSLEQKRQRLDKLIDILFRQRRKRNKYQKRFTKQYSAKSENMITQVSSTMATNINSKIISNTTGSILESLVFDGVGQMNIKLKHGKKK